MAEFKAQVNGHEATEKANISKPGRVVHIGSSLTDSTKIGLSYSYRALGGMGCTSQKSRVQDGGKSRHVERGASNVQCAVSSRSLA